MKVIGGWYALSSVIDLNAYTPKTLEKVVSAYYRSMDELTEIYAEYSDRVIAECVFETLPHDYHSMRQFNSEVEAVKYVMEHIGMQEEGYPN